MESKFILPSHGCRSLWGLFQSSKPTAGLEPSPRHTGFVGSSHHAQEIPVTEVICFHMVIFWDPVLQLFTHVCNFPPASTGIKKQWDALQNNPFGAQWFCFVTVSISVFSSFNIMARFLIFLLNTSLNSYAMSQFRGFKSSIKMTPRLGSTGPQRRC